MEFSTSLSESRCLCLFNYIIVCVFLPLFSYLYVLILQIYWHNIIMNKLTRCADYSWKLHSLLNELKKPQNPTDSENVNFQNINCLILQMSHDDWNILMNAMHRLCPNTLFCSQGHNPLKLLASTLSAFSCPLSCENTVSTLRWKRKISRRISVDQLFL